MLILGRAGIPVPLHYQTYLQSPLHAPHGGMRRGGVGSAGLSGRLSGAQLLLTPGLLRGARECAGSWRRGARMLPVQAIGGGPGSQSTFLSYEEAGLIEMSNLDMHERFLCRLTVSSLNLLRVISEQEGVPIDELNAGLICDWFQRDKAKREQDIDSATLKWEAGPEW